MNVFFLCDKMFLDETDKFLEGILEIILSKKVQFIGQFGSVIDIKLEI